MDDQIDGRDGWLERWGDFSIRLSAVALAATVVICLCCLYALEKDIESVAASRLFTHSETGSGGFDYSEPNLVGMVDAERFERLNAAVVSSASVNGLSVSGQFVAPFGSGEIQMLQRWGCFDVNGAGAAGGVQDNSAVELGL